MFIHAAELATLLGSSLDGNGVTPPIPSASVSFIPDTTVEVFEASDIDDLATGGVITITTSLLLDIKESFVSSTRFVLDGGRLDIISDTPSKSYAYSGSGTFVSGSGEFRVVDSLLVSASTGKFLDLNNLSAGFVIIQGNILSGWDDLGEVNNALAHVVQNTQILDWGEGFTLRDVLFLNSTVVNVSGGPSSGVLYDMVDTVDTTPAIRLTSTGGVLLGTSSIIKLDPALPPGTSVIISDGSIVGGTGTFDEAGAAGTFTAVADAAVASTTIDSVSDSSGVARFNFTVGPTLFVGQEVDITGFVTNTVYNVTMFVTAVGVGFFEIASIAFGTDEGTGDFTSDSITVTDTGTSLIDGDTLVIDTDEATDYDGGATVYNQLTNSFQINRVFTATQTGTWDTSGLNQKDPRVLALLQTAGPNSVYLGCAFMNDNSEPVGTIVNNTFTDVVFGTGGAGLVPCSTIERWKLIDPIAGIFEYTGNEAFDGTIEYNFSVVSSGGSTEFRFKWQKDEGGGYADLTDNVESLAEVGSTASSTSKVQPLVAAKGDRVKPLVTRNSGSSGLTLRYASVNIT